ncbi:hypothetical protein B0H16DRAFT_1465165 [Mycena metata]|uniref:Uncharacterized protein n=1 Tax=Mycena metata TaxID=1033252 RepID=A0AAD7IDC2_9AGAR|nr:hypothetical protein B0H16DRAFT_1465165 [Mycena metata]
MAKAAAQGLRTRHQLQSIIEDSLCHFLGKRAVNFKHWCLVSSGWTVPCRRRGTAANKPPDASPSQREMCAGTCTPNGIEVGVGGSLGVSLIGLVCDCDGGGGDGAKFIVQLSPRGPPRRCADTPLWVKHLRGLGGGGFDGHQRAAALDGRSV